MVNVNYLINNDDIIFIEMPKGKPDRNQSYEEIDNRENRLK